MVKRYIKKSMTLTIKIEYIIYIKVQAAIFRYDSYKNKVQYPTVGTVPSVVNT
jgi:hypothetical protein